MRVVRQFVGSIVVASALAAAPVAAQNQTFIAAESFGLSGTSQDLTSLLSIADVGSNAGPPDGIADVLTAGQDQRITVLYGTGDGALLGGPNTITNRIPTAMVVADFTGDSFFDVVLADSANNILCYRGFSDGPPFEVVGTPQRVGNNPIDFATDDLDGDGKLDLAVLHQGNLSAGEIWVLRGTGNCGFEPFPAPSQVIVPTGLASSSFVMEDFNDDGFPDFAVTNAASNDVSVIHGRADATFAEVQRLSVVPGGAADLVEPIAVAAAQLDADERLDLVVVNRNRDQIAVALGRADGTFAVPTFFASGSNGSSPTSLTLADVDADGRTDVLVANNRSNDASILLGNGDGSFQAARSWVADQEPLGVGVAALTLDTDDDLDVVVTSRGANGPTATVLQGVGNGALRSVENVATATSPSDVAVADLDTDGLPDAVVVNSSGAAEILRSRGDRFEYIGDARLAVDGAVTAVAAADFDGDGLADVALANEGRGSVVFFAGRPGLQFAAPREIVLGAGINALSVGDWTADGRPDVAVLRQLDETSGIIEVIGLNASGIQGPARTTVPGNPVDAVPLRVDADGSIDMVLADIGASRALVMLGRNNGTFGFGTHINAAGAVRAVGTADFDRNACADVLLALSQNGTVQPYFGSCDGNFTAGTQPIRGASNPVRLGVRDFSGDGVADVLLPDEVDNSALLATKNATGQGFITGLDVYPTSRRPIRALAADFDGDGRYDGAVLNSFVAGSVSVLTNRKGEVVNRFDGNGDGVRSAADLVALSRELTDGDGSAVEDVSASGFAGGRRNDADGDGSITTVDRRALAARLFPRS